MKRAITKLHGNLGHPENRVLARAIRLSGGSDTAVRMALDHACDVCRRNRTPDNPAHLPGRIQRPTQFNESVAVDLFELSDYKGAHRLFLNILDRASSFQCVWPVTTKHPPVVLQVFLQMWVAWAGVPERIKADMGGEFRREFCQELTEMGAVVEYAAPYDPT